MDKDENKFYISDRYLSSSFMENDFWYGVSYKVKIILSYWVIIIKYVEIGRRYGDKGL